MGKSKTTEEEEWAPELDPFRRTLSDALSDLNSGQEQGELSLEEWAKVPGTDCLGPVGVGNFEVRCPSVFSRGKEVRRFITNQELAVICDFLVRFHKCWDGVLAVDLPFLRTTPAKVLMVIRSMLLSQVTQAREVSGLKILPGVVHPPYLIRALEEVSVRAAKADDAMVAVTKWDENLRRQFFPCLAGVSLWKWSLTCASMQHLEIRFWRRNTAREARDCLVSKLRRDIGLTMPAFMHETETIGDCCDLVINLKAGTGRNHPDLMRELESLEDCLWRVGQTGFWDWTAGSAPFFWRWTSECQERAREGVPIFVLGELPRKTRK